MSTNTFRIGQMTLAYRSTLPDRDSPQATHLLETKKTILLRLVKKNSPLLFI